MRIDDDKHSESLDVTQELRQGRVLSPLLLNVFFVSAIHVVLLRFSEDEDIVRDWVHLEEDVVVGKRYRWPACKGSVGYVVR